MAHVLPERRVSSEELASQFRDAAGAQVVSGRVLQRLTGVSERRYAAPGQCSSDLAAQAAIQALERAAVSPESIDIVIFASASHDVAEPASANRVQALVGCVNAQAFDVKNACNSFLNGLDIARAMLNSDGSLRVLVATGEVISPFVRMQVPADIPVRGLIAGLTLGDGGAAVLVAASEEVGIEIGAARFHSLGQHWASSAILGGGSLDGQDFSRAYFVSDSSALFRLAIDQVPLAIGRVLCQTGWEVDEVDLVVPHQASIAVIQKVCELTSIPFEKCVITGDRLGNTAAASIPTALSIAADDGRLDRAERVLLVGGAAGFSSAAMALSTIH